MKRNSVAGLRTLSRLAWLLGAAVVALSATGHRIAFATDVGSAKATIVSWSLLQKLKDVCPGAPDQHWRLQRLATAIGSSVPLDAMQYAAALRANARWNASLERDVADLLQMVGGCETDAMREWQASAWRYLDSQIQLFAGDVTTQWPAPAVGEPIRLNILRFEAEDDDDPGVLQVSAVNVGTRRVGIALSGKELRSGLCPSVTSADIPITEQGDFPVQTLMLAPNETKRLALKLGKDCFIDDVGALSGAMIVVRDEFVEYRAFNQLGIRRLTPAGDVTEESALTNGDSQVTVPAQTAHSD